MTDDQWTWTSDRTLPSDTAVGREVIDELLAKLQENAWGEHDVFGINLSVEEALVNAIKHGNQEHPDKTVHVVCMVSPIKVRVEITDQGDGFDPGDVPDPTDDENLEIPHGRGLMLMRSFMSLVEFNESGNQVVMEKVPSVDEEDDDDDFFAD